MAWLLLPICPLILLVFCGYTTIRFPVKANTGKKRIACVGDSITYGCTLPLFFLNRFPTILQRLLGDKVQVAAFGVNDRTLQSTGNKPFRKERAFAQSMKFAPSIVVILLGTNDSKDVNWISPNAFKQQYKGLIDDYRALPSSPRIVICTPTCAFTPINRFFYITNDAKLDRVPEIAALVKEVAEEESCDVVDLYSLTQEHRDMFGPDGLHPSLAGAKTIAEEIYAFIEGFPKVKETQAQET